MLTSLVLWGHALAALLFVAAALGLRGDHAEALPRGPLIVALLLTALWALAVAGIDARDVSVRALVGPRDVAWLAAMLAMARRGRQPLGGAATLYAAAMAVAVLASLVSVVEGAVSAPGLVAALAEARTCLRALGLLAALLLVIRLPAETVATRLIVVALTMMWSSDLTVLAAAQGAGGWPLPLVAVRGGVMVVVALLVATAAGRREDQAFAVSRAAAVRLIAIAGLAGYAGIVALLNAVADMLCGDHARLAQTAIVFGATAALLTLLSTPWLRAWAKVMLAKHLFSHRYDYRAEWARFSETLAGADATALPLGERVARAIADLTVSPSALLFVAEGEGLALAAAADWPEPPDLGDGVSLAGHLGDSGRIIELDALRASAAPADDLASVPAALFDAAQAWAIVPLAHRGGLIGAVVVARPPVHRALDWEDFDLLRVAGRQAAGALAEDRARRALADAERFDEFNRRFAFILHDIKNLVSQLSLVARNAERHADNPVFRADMIATLTDASGRLQGLLARLSPQAGRREPAAPIQAAALLDGIAARRRSLRAISCTASPDLWLLGDRAGLETVLDHLVQNAIDASGPDAPITLAAEAEGGDVAIVVADRGSGMSAAFVRDQLFRPFVSTKPGGFGLGAFEARQTIEAMGGRVEIASREGPEEERGTRVTLRLPAALALENAA